MTPLSVGGSNLVAVAKRPSLRPIESSPPSIRNVRQPSPTVSLPSAGRYVYDVDGKKYIDALAGLWSIALGIVLSLEDEIASLQLWHSLPYGRFQMELCTNPDLIKKWKRMVLNFKVFPAKDAIIEEDGHTRFLLLRLQRPAAPLGRRLIWAKENTCKSLELDFRLEIGISI
ncbi:Probable gamma-aminobutyrate transaminase 3, mitochondrial [Linum perenne]